MYTTCPVCKQNLKGSEERPEGTSGDFFSCPKCGNYIASKSALSVLPSKLELEKDADAKISHMLRQANEYGNIPTLYTNTINEVIKRKLPNPKEQADLIIRWLGKTLDGPGQKVDISSADHSSIIGAKSDDGLKPRTLSDQIISLNFK